jgi:peptidylprolyl isomerase
MWKNARQARSGDTVQVHYTGRLADGSVCVSTVDRRPLQFVVGRGRIIPGIEQAVVGMQARQSKTVTVEPQDAFGVHREGMLIKVDRKRVQNGLRLQIGQRLRATCANGRVVPVTVLEVSESRVTLDTNHPLAGETITFDIRLVRIV